MILRPAFDSYSGNCNTYYHQILKVVDKANGYLFGDMEREKRAQNLLYNVDSLKGSVESDYHRTMVSSSS